MPLSEWMAEFSRLDDGGRFRAFPFQNGIADAFTDPDTSQISVRKSSRIGYSTIVQGYAGYCISTDPRRLLIYQPTIDDAENYSKDDLEPVLQWPAVRAVATFKPRHRDNQIRSKRFKGGWIQIKGANSPKEFRRVTADSVLLEEPDGYPWSAKEEGDPARLAFKRNLTSPRRFSAAGSTPKIKGWSRIDALFEQGNGAFVASYGTPGLYTREVNLWYSVGPYEIDTMISEGLLSANYDALAVALYPGDGICADGEDDLAIIDARILAAVNAVVAYSPTWKAKAIALNKRLICYEINFSFNENVMTIDTFLAWMARPATKTTFRALLDGWVTNCGDLLCIFQWCSPPYSAGFGIAQWGMRTLHNDTPTTRLEALQEAMAA